MTTLIIGGGLSGLALADMLHRRGHEFRLLEARDRLGGRILTEQLGDASFDMGPAWFWPGQPRMAALIDRLGLETFEQYAEGLLAVEDAQGQVQHGRAHAAMQGSLRVGGGLAAVTHALAEALPPDLIRCGAQVAYLARAEGTITATLTTGEPLQAERVVLAMPPRIAATLDYIPALPAASLEAMRGVSTWMAGQAKALAVYEAPFWREAGLSGDAMSRHGPMVEIHDASPMHGGPYGLFGFIGVPAEARTDHDTLRAAVIAQLVRLFGPQAATPSHVFLKDWAHDPLTAVAADMAPLYAHPTYGLPPALSGLWDDKLLMAGTEVAPQFGGFVEGALEAAKNAFARLTGERHAPHDAPSLFN